ncbi:hypothetical protein [Desulfofundulus thermobenzoicus]|nr:hypothetical protein [Desulfofundulus thermobenzoicus]
MMERVQVGAMTGAQKEIAAALDEEGSRRWDSSSFWVTGYRPC